MRVLCFFALSLFITLPVARLAAADAKWLHVTSAHFDMYTSESEGDAKSALQHLEATRGYLIAATHFHDPGGQPVRIVAFKSEGDYGKYRPQEASGAKVYSLAAATTPAPTPAMIVSAGLKADMYEQLFREYVQLVLDDVAPTLPYWFRAGLASVYSTLKPTENGMNIGAAPRTNYRNGEAGDVDLQPLFSISREAYLASRNKSANDFNSNPSTMGSTNGQQTGANARDPNGSQSTALRNVQSTLEASQDYAHAAWVLTHMTMFQQEYRPKFAQFMQTLSMGTETGAAYVKVYERPVTRVRTDLATYAKQTGIMVVTAPYKPEKFTAPEIRPAAKEEQDRIFADLAKH
jgi:hypothetical protein